MPQFTTKLFFALLYLGILLFVSGRIVHQMGKFTGYIVLKPGQTERWVLRESTTEGMLATALRNMPMEIVGLNHFQTAAQFFDRSKHFDAVQLPFYLSLEKELSREKIKEKYVLTLRRGESSLEKAVRPGQKIDIYDSLIDIVAVQPWSGLVRDERGTPHMVMQVEDTENAAINKLFFENASFFRPGKDFSVEWHWVQSEEEAEHKLQELQHYAGKWGIREAERVHWFETLTPGDGLITSDGTEYTLLGYETSENSSALTVSIEIKDKDTRKILQYPGSDTVGGTSVLLDPGKQKNHIICISWQENSTLCTFFKDGIPEVSRLVQEEEWLDLPVSENHFLRCTLLQVLEKSFVVTAEESTLKALCLQVDGTPLALREGESCAAGDLLLSFSREKILPVPKFLFTTELYNSQSKDSFTLTGSRKIRINNWKLSIAPQFINNGTMPVIIKAERMLGTPSQLVGLTICLLGIIGLTVFRFADWRQEKDRENAFKDDYAG